MEKSELQSRIRLANETQEIVDNRQRDERLISETFAQIGTLATQICDLFGAQPEGPFTTTAMYSHFNRTTPKIPIGEVDPTNTLGRTHGFLKITMKVANDYIFPPRPSKNRHSFGLPKSTVKDRIDRPGDQVLSVGISLFSGRSDGSDFKISGGSYETSNKSMKSSPQNIDELNMENLKKHQEMIDILQIIISEATLPVGSTETSS